jgi:hypothetical protein
MRAVVVAGVTLFFFAVPLLAQNATPGRPDDSVIPTMPPRTPTGSRAFPAVPPPADQQAAVAGTPLVGLAVRSAADERLGEIDDVIVDAGGSVRAVVVAIGGFLGIGARMVAIPWDQFTVDGDHAVVDMTKDQLRALPEQRVERPH